MTHETTASKVTHVRAELLVWVVVLDTLLWGSNVNLIVLESHDGLLHTGQDPGASTDTNELKEKGNAKKNVGDGVVQEGDGVS